LPTYYSDSPSEFDLLGRTEFAKDIASSLLTGFKSGNDSIVIGINGKWGCGKSTLLKFIKQEISQNVEGDKTVIFEFNPWLFSGQKELQTVFFRQLLLKMRSLQQRVSKPTKKLKRYVELITPLLRALAKVSLLARYIHPGIAELVSEFEKFLTAFDKDRPLDEVKEKVNKQIEKTKTRFFIFIDDVERLTPQETTEIFQLIKLNANFKNTFYIIAYDREIVQESLMLQYKEIGRRYLDKIVQVDYKVPEIFDETLEDVFFEKLQLFFEENAINYDTKQFFKIWQHNDFRGYFTTLRDIYRYINALQLRLPAIHEEVAIADFLILEAIRLFDHFSYEEIYKSYKLSLIKKHSIHRLLVENNEFQNKSNPFSRALVNTMFRLKEDLEVEGNDGKPISDRRYFERYFSLSLNSVDVIGDFFNQFIYNEEGRVALLAEVFSSDKGAAFLRRLFNSLVLPEQVNIEKLIYDLINFGSQYYNQIRMERYAEQFFELIDDLIQKFPDHSKGYQWFLTEVMHSKYENNLFIAFLLGKYYEKINLAFEKNVGDGKTIDHLIGVSGISSAGFDYFRQIEEVFQNTIEAIFRKKLMLSTETGEKSFFVKYLLLKYAGFFPNAYYEYLEKILRRKDHMKMLELIECTINFNLVTGKPVALSKAHLALIFPDNKLLGKIIAELGTYSATKYSDVVLFAKKHFADKLENNERAIAIR
jgi:hypothetical protein